MSTPAAGREDSRVQAPWRETSDKPAWRREHLRHALGIFRKGRNPAATVYDSIGDDFFLAVAPGWLNLGLWDGPGTEEEAPLAVRRLVQVLASPLPVGGVILDVGNGLGVQDPVIAEVARPRYLMAMNITESQLRAGRDAMRAAGAAPILADAMRIPLVDDALDGLISVEAAFHFPSRQRFFREAFRVLRPGSTLSMSDIPITRRLRGPSELLAGFSQLRLWGLASTAAATPEEIAASCRAAGFVDVETELVGDRVIEPMFRLTSDRLSRRTDAPVAMRLAGRFFLSQVRLLWQRRAIEYLLLRARRP